MALATILHCKAVSAMLLHHENCEMVVYLGNGHTPLLQMELRHDCVYLGLCESHMQEIPVEAVRAHGDGGVDGKTWQNLHSLRHP